MAYEIKYRTTAATKGNTEATINIYENDYIGDIIEYPCVNLQIQYIPRSDDIFEAIYVSELNLILDVTDDVDSMPDFTTLNDRKYFVRVLIDDTLQWQGWALSDNVQFSFTTGRKELVFNAIDGIGMLEKIPFPLPDEYTLTGNDTLINFIAGAFSKLEYPLDYNIVSGISFFAAGMDNRIDAAINDPLNQTYVNYATFVNDSQVANSCLSVITDIARSFGARLFQANGDFYIVPLTQLAQDSYYSTIYNSSGVATSAVTQSLNGNIEAFTGNTSGLYFVDNGQYKLIRKGYNKILLSKDIEFPKNYITNWDLKKYTHISTTEDNAFSWTEVRNGGLVYIKNNPTQKYNGFIMSIGASAPYYTSVSPDNMPNVLENDIIKINFNVNAIGAPASGPDGLFILKIEITDGTVTYLYDSDKKWRNIVDGANYYYEPFNGDDPKANVSLTLPAAPFAGDLTIELIVNGGTSFWKYTTGAIIAEDFELEIEPSFKSFVTQSYINDSEEYLYELDLPLGFNNITDGYYSYRGFLSDSTGLNLKNWYRQEYPDQTYRSLSELVVKQYSNCLNKNIINIDSSFMSVETANGRFNASMKLSATDTDPIQINVNDKSFLLGNSTIDYVNDVITATLLDVNTSNIDTTLLTTYNTNNLSSTEPTGYGHFRSTGFLTREAAYAAPLTETQIYLTNDGFPSIGDVYYVDSALGTPFNGAQLWWKVMTSEVSFSAFKISSSGAIMEIYL